MEEEKKVLYQIRTLSNSIRRAMNDVCTNNHNVEITPIQGMIIAYIYDKSKSGDVFQRDIEKDFNIRRSTATAILKLMEKNELITRCQVDYDARLKKLNLTEKSKALNDILFSKIDLIENKITQNLTKGEVDYFFEIMQKMKNNIEPQEKV